MLTMTANTSQRSTLPVWKAVALCMFLVVQSPCALSAKDTPFGAELIIPGYPNITTEHIDATMDVIATMGSFASLIWFWSNRPVLANITPLISMMHEHGLKSMVQIGPTWLGAASPPEGFTKSFADPRTRALYLYDVEEIARGKPDYLVLMTEANLTYRFARPDFEAYRTLYTDAYNRVKAISPNTQVGVSHLYPLWFADYVVNGIDVPAMLGPSDFYAFTTYPQWLVTEGHFPTIADIPEWFHGVVRTAYPDESIIFSEVGWASKGRGSPEQQAEFVRELPRLLSGANPTLISWAVLSDLEFFNRSLLSDGDITFLEGLGVDIDLLFEHFNAMGLLDGFGNPKPALWESLNLDFGNGNDLTGKLLSQTITAVPEPEIYGMMLAGLALLGFASRRRIRSASV